MKYDPYKKESKHYRFRNIEFWAQGGLVRMIDISKAEDSSKTADDYFISLPPRDFIKRAIAACTMVRQTPDELFEARQFLERASRVCDIAKSQGDPTDPKVQDWCVKHKNATGAQIQVPGVQYRFKKAAPEDILKNGYEIVSTSPLILPGQG